MACFTLNPGHSHMPPVREENVFWHPVKGYPWDLSVFLSVLLDFGLFSTLSDGFFMAFPTDLDLWRASKGLLSHVLVACTAFHSLLLVGFMVKLDGLLHPSPHHRGKKEDHD
jgi:hypothetical protein